ncbi:hypothetical protein OHA37_13970 [Streptomyces sp. NBC_00335]|uniref:hypothetical protein n=1 Tax=unclassified Streptomyces TaxID=2593676 RepID=UPI002259CCD4|nr:MULTISPECIES: hypothetical protein [unclassified Streptomyces]MCX5404988.1 hypothetical protein [Streptomyces sp. NBC_00086]
MNTSAGPPAVTGSAAVTGPADFDGEAVFGPLRDAGVRDVLLPGFIDRDGPLPLVRPLGSTVYLALADGGHIRLDAVRGEGQLTLSRTDAPRCPPEHEDDDEFAVVPYGPHFLGDDSDIHAVTRVRYVLDGAGARLPGAFRCAELSFQYGGRLFLDPMYYWGIRLQGAGAYEQWLAHHRDRPGHGPYTEHAWHPQAPADTAAPAGAVAPAGGVAPAGEAAPG